MMKILRPGQRRRVDAGRDQDRPGQRQRHRDPRGAGLTSSRDVDADARAASEIQDTAASTARSSTAPGSTAALLHEGDVVTIGNIDLVFAGGTLVRRTETAAATRTGGLDVRGVTWTIENNKTLLDNISLLRAARHADRGDRPVGCGQVDVRAGDGRHTHPTHGHSVVRGPRHSRRVRLVAQRIGMVPQDDVVHGQLTVDQALGYAAELRLPPDTTKEDRAPGGGAGARGTRDDPARAHPGRQAVRRSAQACVGGDGVADRAVAADPRRADVRPGSRAGPAGDDDAAAAGRRRPRGAGGHALADLPGRLRPGAAAGSRRQDGVLRAARADRRGDGHDELGRHLQRRSPAIPTRPTARTWRRPVRRRHPAGGEAGRTRAIRRTPACCGSSPRSPGDRCG